MQNKELRSYQHSGRVEVRSNGKTGRIATGHAIVFAPSRSQDLGGFVEQIDPSSIDLSTVGNVYALRGHDSSRQLASTDTGTLRLFKDTRGIRFEIDLPDTTDGNDLAELFSRTGPKGSSDAGRCSFGFIATRDNWKELADGTILRTVLEMELFEISIGVVFPAYTDTTAALRSADARTRAKIALKQRDSLVGQIPKDTYDNNLNLASANDCECRCNRCLDNDCDNCVDADCDSERCLNCPNQGDSEDDAGERSRLLQSLLLRRL